MLPGLFALALAADSWNATCAAKDDPSVWFVFTSAADAPPLPDYDCKGLFFDSTVSCTQTVGMGKIRPAAEQPGGGTPILELRYLPYGNAQTIVTFLSQPGGGVVHKPPTQAATSPAATPPPLNSVELLSQYLHSRAKASAPTKNITLHVWSCPDSGFIPPTEAISPYGMKLVEHSGRIPMY